ncbi:MAG: hypothetical protein JWM80_6417 [Cyanobacteria bacterium RYN_339]|nr:hypothetical protein [Cyanobacteria bacterium RYN_339]
MPGADDATLSVILPTPLGFEWRRVNPAAGTVEGLGQFEGDAASAQVIWDASPSRALLWSPVSNQAWLVDLVNGGQRPLNPPTTWGDMRAFYFSDRGEIVMAAHARSGTRELRTVYAVWSGEAWYPDDASFQNIPPGAQVISRVGPALQTPGPRRAELPRLDAPRRTDVTDPSTRRALDALLPRGHSANGIWGEFEDFPGRLYVRMIGTVNPDTFEVMSPEDTLAYEAWPLVIAKNEALFVAPGREFAPEEQIFVHRRGTFVLATNGLSQAQMYNVASGKLVFDVVGSPTPRFWPRWQTLRSKPKRPSG